MKLRLSEQAQHDIETIDSWWHEHRPAAPSPFRQELRAAIEQIEANPESGTPCLGAKKPYRRVIFLKSKYLDDTNEYASVILSEALCREVRSSAVQAPYSRQISAAWQSLSASAEHRSWWAVHCPRA